MRALAGGAARRAAEAAGHLFRRVDYPVSLQDWLSLCSNPQTLGGPHDWGLALAEGSPSAHPRRAATRDSRLAELVRHFTGLRDPRAGEALAALAARFAAHLELGSQFDCACTLPSDFRSGAGDAAGHLFAWPGVEFPLAVHRDFFAWAIAGGAGLSHGMSSLRLTAPVRGLSVLIVQVCFEAERADAAVHVLRAGGARRVGVLALVGCGGSDAV